MKKKYRFLKDWKIGEKDYAKDTVIEGLADDEAEVLKANGVIELVDEAAEDLRKQHAEWQKNMEKLIQSTVTNTLSGMVTTAEERAKLIKVGVDRETKDPRGGFKTAGHFYSDVHVAAAKNVQSEELTKWGDVCKATMVEGTDSAGGFLVPDEFGETIVTPMLEASIVAPRASRRPMKGNHLKFPSFIDKNHNTGHYFGGVETKWEGEIEQSTGTAPKVEQIELTLHDLKSLVRVSNDLLEDSPLALEAHLNDVVPQALAFELDYAFLNGTGAGQPLGILATPNPALIVVAKQGSQANNTIVFTNVSKIHSRFRVMNPASVAWLIDRDAIVQLEGMSIAVGTGGIPVFMPAQGVAVKGYNTLYGYPVIPTEKVATLGSQGDILLADFSQYLIGDKGGIKFATSMHVYFDTHEMAFRWVLRADGKSAWLSTLTPRNGGSTISPFVTLAERKT